MVAAGRVSGGESTGSTTPSPVKTLSQITIESVRFNVDCTLATTHYQKNEGLFAQSTGGGEGGGGSCPSVSPLPPASCEGSVDTCWSPGQPDGDCPNFGLCCFDGCSNTCPQGMDRTNSREVQNESLLMRIATTEDQIVENIHSLLTSRETS